MDHISKGIDRLYERVLLLQMDAVRLACNQHRKNYGTVMKMKDSYVQKPNDMFYQIS